VTEQQILDLDPALADYLDRFLFCCDYTQTFDHLGTYCRGLLSDLERKTVEPIALAAGTPVRSLQLFLTQHRWDREEVRDLLQGHVAGLLPALPPEPPGGLGTLGIIDESGHVKKGEHTPGVHRQYCGEVGKQENCIVTVHLAVARGHYKGLIDADLFLPECWDKDRDRCKAAGIPDTVVHRPKWRIALEQLDRAQANGVRLDWLTFDEEYGKSPEFLQGLRRRGQPFVGEVPCLWHCFGRAEGAEHSSRADDLVRYSPLFTRQPWREVRLARQTLGEQAWQYKAARVWLAQDKEPVGEPYWLVWARNERTGEEKYFVSGEGEGAEGAGLLPVGFGRWNVEHGIRLGKDEVGLKHYEGRRYTGLMRHLTLCLVVLNFVAEQTTRLRGEKPGGDRGAGVPGGKGGVPGVAGAAAGHDVAGVHRGGHPVPPEAQPGRPRVTAEAGRGAARGALSAA
jgi:SRSO17 transposase